MQTHIHRDAYVLGQGFCVFSPLSGTLGEKNFYHEMKPIKYATIFKKIIGYKHKPIACTLTFKNKKRSKNAKIPDGQINFEREK